MKVIKFDTWVFKSDEERFSDLKKVYPEHIDNIYLHNIINMYHKINSKFNRRYIITKLFLSNKINKSKIDLNFYMNLYDNLYIEIDNSEKSGKYLKLNSDNIKIHDGGKRYFIKNNELFIKGVYIDDTMVKYNGNLNLFYDEIDNVLKYKLMKYIHPPPYDDSDDEPYDDLNKQYDFTDELSLIYINSMLNTQTNIQPFVKQSLAFDNYVDNPIFYNLFIIIRSDLYINMELYLSIEILLNIIDLLENVGNIYSDMEINNINIYVILVLSWILNKYLTDKIYVNKNNDLYKNYMDMLNKYDVKIDTIIDFKFRYIIYIYETLFEKEYIKSKRFYKTSNKLYKVIKYTTNLIKTYTIKKTKNYFTHDIKFIPQDNNFTFTEYNRFKRNIDNEIYKNFINDKQQPYLNMYEHESTIYKRKYPSFKLGYVITSDIKYNDIILHKKNKFKYNDIFIENKYIDDSFMVINNLYKLMKNNIKDIKYLINYCKLKNRINNSTDKEYIEKLNKFTLYYKQQILKNIWLYNNNLLNNPKMRKKTLYGLLLENGNITKIYKFLIKHANMDSYDLPEDIIKYEKRIQQEITQSRFEVYFNLTPKQKLIIDKIDTEDKKNEILDAIGNMLVPSDLITDDYVEDNMIAEYPDE